MLMRTVAAVTALVALLGGCGDDDDDTTRPASDVAAVAEQRDGLPDRGERGAEEGSEVCEAYDELSAAMFRYHSYDFHEDDRVFLLDELEAFKATLSGDDADVAEPWVAFLEELLTYPPRVDGNDAGEIGAFWDAEPVESAASSAWFQWRCYPAP